MGISGATLVLFALFIVMEQKLKKQVNTQPNTQGLFSTEGFSADDFSLDILGDEMPDSRFVFTPEELDAIEEEHLPPEELVEELVQEIEETLPAPENPATATVRNTLSELHQRTKALQRKIQPQEDPDDDEDGLPPFIHP
jgi:hypothetical protein